MQSEEKSREYLSAELGRVHADLAAQRKACAVYEAFFQFAPIGLAVATDAGGQNIRTNPAFARLLDLRPGANASLSAPEAEKPKHFRVMKDGEELPPEQLPIQRSAASGMPIDDHECHIVFDDGRVVDLWGKTAPLLDEQGRPAGAIGAFVDVTRLRRAEADLTQARDQALAAGRAKDEFLAILSHELRTPLNAVVAMMDAWEASPDLPETYRDEARLIRRNIDVECRLIDDLLDLQRIAHGKFSVDLRPADVHELLHAVLEMTQSDLHAKGVKLILSLDAGRHVALADAARLQQVLWNVLRNSAKFTRKGGTVTIRTSNPTGGAICVSVADDGIGMSAETLGRLFQPFQQADNQFVRRSGGLGLGLSIARKLIELQGGRIRAESPGIGRGATLVVSLPTTDRPLASGPTHLSSPADRFCRPLQLLLVEDHHDTARAMSRLLRAFGHDVDVSGTVAEAVAAVGAKAYDVVLSDIGLPDGSGMELIGRIRETSPVPVVAMTGYGMEEDGRAFQDAGFVAHLTKPVNLPQLELVIQRVTGQGTAAIGTGQT
jgi:signal transduction histidine kinase/ActR/RegA family two-component response regulator